MFRKRAGAQPCETAFDCPGSPFPSKKEPPSAYPSEQMRSQAFQKSVVIAC